MNKHSLRNANHALRGSAVALAVLLWAGSPAIAQVSVGISMPGVNIGINMPMYPDLVRVPDYPVYYAPGLQTNFFFYDGMYWVYQQDNWYAGSWYNGPWTLVGPQAVPLFVLRIPVRYYRNPPEYFRGWGPDAPPRWGDHWGNQWALQRSGWDRWDRRAIPAPAPLPVYQRQYSGSRYPQVEQQRALQTSNYRYQPRDAVVRQQYQQQAAGAKAPEQPVQGRAAAAVRPQQEVPSQRTQPQPSLPGGQRAQDSAPPVRPVARTAEPTQGQEQEQGRSAGKGKAKEKGRDTEGEGGRQGTK